MWAVLAAALLLRLAYLADLRHTPFFAHPQMDALYHDRWAKEIAGGSWLGSAVYFRAPLYPYFLGLFYAVAGVDYLGVRLLQFSIGAGTAFLTAALSYRRLGRVGAVGAGMLVAFHGPSIYFEGELLLVVLEAPLFLLAAWSLDRAWGGSGRGRWIAAGALLGLAALVRPTALAVLPAAAVVLLVRRGRSALAPASLYAGALLVAISPVLIRNAAVGKDLVPVASQGGLNYYLGNNPHADGMAALAPEFRKTWAGGIEDARRLAEAEAGRPLKPSAVSRYWYRRAFAWAREDPLAFLSLQLKKLAYFWDAFEIPNNQDYYFFSRLTRLFRLPVLSGFWLLGPLALAGLVLGIRRRTLGAGWILVPATLIAVIAAFFVCGRFRASLAPLLAVWAGAGIGGAASLVRSGRRRELLPYLAVLVAAGAVLNLDPWGHRRRHGPAESYLRLGIHYAAPGDRAHAIEAYRSAVAARPDFADGWNNLGVVLAEEGSREEAERAFERAVALDPSHPKALGNLAKAAFDRGDLARADSLARRTLAVGGEYTALMTAAVILGNLGHLENDPVRLEEALDGFRAARVLDPASADAALGEARALLRLGRTDEARRALTSLPPGARTPEVRALLEAVGGEPPSPKENR